MISQYKQNLTDNDKAKIYWPADPLKTKEIIIILLWLCYICKKNFINFHGKTLIVELGSLVNIPPRDELQETKLTHLPCPIQTKNRQKSSPEQLSCMNYHLIIFHNFRLYVTLPRPMPRVAESPKGANSEKGWLRVGTTYTAPPRITVPKAVFCVLSIFKKKSVWISPIWVGKSVYFNTIKFLLQFAVMTCQG